MNWLHRLVSRLDIDPKRIVPLFALCLGFQRAGRWVPGCLKFGHAADQSLFFNGVLFVRMMLPCFVGIGIRWRGRDPAKREFLQSYIGWKLNGQFSIVFRVQSDVSAAAGYTSPNSGQAIGWNEGPK